MGTLLSVGAIDRYRRDGYYAPIRAVSREEAAQYRERLEAAERDLGGPLRGIYRIKPHLLFPWLADLVRHPAVLDAVEDVLGPDVLCWNSSFFTKEAASPGYVSWHQDAIRYIPTRVRQVAGPRDSATLVRGQDAFGHFDLEPAPTADLDPAALALHADISDRQVKILYRGTTRTSF